MGQKKLIRFEAIKSFLTYSNIPKGWRSDGVSCSKMRTRSRWSWPVAKEKYTVGRVCDVPGAKLCRSGRKGQSSLYRRQEMPGGEPSQCGLSSHPDRPDRRLFPPGCGGRNLADVSRPCSSGSPARPDALPIRKFIRSYQRILRPGGLIHLKTDSPVLYRFTKWVADMYGLSILEDSENIYASPVRDELNIRTHYESLDIAQSQRVHYLCLRFIWMELSRPRCRIAGEDKERGASTPGPAGETTTYTCSGRSAQGQKRFFFFFFNTAQREDTNAGKRKGAKPPATDEQVLPDPYNTGQL